MYILRLLTIFCFLFCLSSQAKTVNLMILGLVDKPNVDEFGKSAFYFIKRAEKKGEKVYFGSPRKYSFVNKKHNFHTVTKAQDIKDMLKEIKKDLSPTDQLNIFINGHGHSTNNENKPEETGIVLKNGKISHDLLDQYIDDEIPFMTKVKITAPYCFSGGIHSISFYRPNTCSVSATDFRTPSYGEGDIFFGTTSSYGTNFSKLINKKPILSLADAHKEIVLSDFRNDQRGSLSSMDFIKRKLSQSQYGSSQSLIDRLSGEPIKYTKPSNPIHKLCNNLNNDDFLNGSKIDPFLNDFSKVLSHLEFEDIFNNKKIPSFVIDRYKKIWNKYKKNYPKFLKIYKQSLITHNAVLKSQQNKVVSWKDKKFLNEIKHETKQMFSQLLYLYKIKDDLKRINDFYSTSDKYDIQKFEDLVRCENDPL
jgi:hypothetical protein